MTHLQNNLNNLSELNKILTDVNTSIEIVHTFIGKKLGEGASRDVYEFNLDPNKYVVKVAKESTTSNYVEAIIWDEVQHFTGDMQWVKEWFAPVHYISPNAKILIMARTHNHPSKKRPSQVPAFLCDIKRSNFGWYRNKLVCHDYGFLYPISNYKKKFQQVGAWVW
jgi:hypothetical protein